MSGVLLILVRGPSSASLRPTQGTTPSTRRDTRSTPRNREAHLRVLLESQSGVEVRARNAEWREGLESVEGGRRGEEVEILRSELGGLDAQFDGVLCQRMVTRSIGDLAVSRIRRCARESP